MRFFEAMRVAGGSMFRDPVRLVVTTAALTVGVAAVLAMISISDGAQEAILRDLRKIGGADQFTLTYRPNRWVDVETRGWRRVRTAETFTYGDVLAIERECPSVARVIPLVRSSRPVRLSAGTAPDVASLRVPYIATNDAFETGLSWHPSAGRFLHDADMVDSAKVAIIGRSVAQALFGWDEAVGETLRLSGERFTIIGVMASRGISIQSGEDFDSTIILPLPTAQRRLRGNSRMDAITVQCATSERLAHAAAEVGRLMRRRHGVDRFYDISAPGAENLGFVVRLSTTLRAVLGGFAAFSFFVGAAGLANTMLISVTERTPEIGLRKAVGARRGDIFAQFLVESLALSVAGVLVGIAGGLGLGWVLARILSDPNLGGFVGALIGFSGQWIDWPWSPSIIWTVTISGICIAIGTLFGVYPAIRAARLQPSSSLRYE